MTDPGFKRGDPRILPADSTDWLATQLAAGIKQRVTPGGWLDIVGHLVAWVVAEEARRSNFADLRVRLNATLGPAIATGLDVGYTFGGHGAKVEIDPPYGKRTP